MPPHNNDMADALALAMHSSSLPSVDGTRPLMRDATEIAQMQAEAEYNRRRNRHEGFDVQCRMEYSLERHDVRVETSVRADLRHTVMLDPRDLENPRYMEDIVRRTTDQFTRQFEAEVMQRMMEARTRMRAERYGRSPAREYLRHTQDLFRAIFEMSEAAEIEGAISWLADFPHKTFEHEGWTAHALDTADKIRAEGETMSHCLGKSYIARINKAEYIAYHITAPEGQGYPKSGFTLGFHKRDHGFEYDQLKGKKNSTHYNEDAKLLAIVDKIRVALCGDTKNIKNGDRVNVRIDLRSGAINIVNRALGAMNVS